MEQEWRAHLHAGQPRGERGDDRPADPQGGKVECELEARLRRPRQAN
jgi:hypothetical protein